MLKVILTNNAKQFVTELPFQTLTKNKVYTDTFTELNEEENTTYWLRKMGW